MSHDHGDVVVRDNHSTTLPFMVVRFRDGYSKSKLEIRNCRHSQSYD